MITGKQNKGKNNQLMRVYRNRGRKTRVWDLNGKSCGFIRCQKIMMKKGGSLGIRNERGER